MQKGKILDYGKSYARDVSPSMFYLNKIIDNILGKFQELFV
jgi:hypothetical protein